MNNQQTPSLTPSVSAALAGWLSLTPGERQTLHAAMTALQALGRPTGGEGRPPMPDTRADAVDSLSIDALPAVDHALFSSQAYRALGTGETFAFYLAGSRGCFRLSQPLGIPFYKIGMTRGLTLETRLASLRQSQYAGVWKSGPDVMFEPGFDTWEATIVPLERPRPAGSPVRCLSQALAIDLPAGVDPDAIDRTLMQALASRSLAAFAASDSGRAHCTACDVDVARLARFTARDTQRGRRYRRAIELFRVAPRQDAEALAGLIEAAVAEAAIALMTR